MFNLRSAMRRMGRLSLSGAVICLWLASLAALALQIRFLSSDPVLRLVFLVSVCCLTWIVWQQGTRVTIVRLKWQKELHDSYARFNHQLLFLFILVAGLVAAWPLRSPLLASLAVAGWIWNQLHRQLVGWQRGLLLLGLMLFCAPGRTELTSVLGLNWAVQAAQSRLLDFYEFYHIHASQGQLIWVLDRTIDLTPRWGFSEYSLLIVGSLIALVFSHQHGRLGAMLFGTFALVMTSKLIATLVAIWTWNVPLEPRQWGYWIYGAGWALTLLAIVSLQLGISRIGKKQQTRAFQEHRLQKIGRLVASLAPFFLPIGIGANLAYLYGNCPNPAARQFAYSQEFERRVQQRQWESAVRLFPKLVQSRLQNSITIYQLVEGLIDQKQAPLGYEIMVVALERRLVETRAHLWLANRLLKLEDRHKTVPGKSWPELAEHHFQLANQHLKDDPDCLLGLVYYLVQRQKIGQAIDLIKQASNVPAERGIVLARVLHRVGDTQSALAELEKIEQQLTAQIKKSQNQPPHEALVQQYLLLAETLVIQRKFQQASDLLKRAYAESNNDRLRDTFIAVGILQCRSKQLDSDGELKCLQESARLNAQQPDLLEYCARRYFQTDQDQTSNLGNLCWEIIQPVVQQIDAASSHDKLIFSIVGTGFASQGKYSQAEAYLSRALKYDQSDYWVLNNLAWVKFQLAPQTHLTEALQLVNRSLTLNPQASEALMTRAEIYEYQSQLTLAIADLESANRIDATNQQLRLKLAALYRKAGAEDLALRFEKHSPPLKTQQ